MKDGGHSIEPAKLPMTYTTTLKDTNNAVNLGTGTLTKENGATNGKALIWLLKRAHDMISRFWGQKLALFCRGECTATLSAVVPHAVIHFDPPAARLVQMWDGTEIAESR